MSYLTSRYFQPKFTSSERYAIMELYKDEKWSYVKTYLGRNERLKISKNAIKLSEKIKLQLDIDLFPLIIPIATKGFDLSGGTYSFEMINDKGQSYYFDCRANFYLKVKSKLMIYFGVDNVISIL